MAIFLGLTLISIPSLVTLVGVIARKIVAKKPQTEEEKKSEVVLLPAQAEEEKKQMPRMDEEFKERESF